MEIKSLTNDLIAEEAQIKTWSEILSTYIKELYKA